MEMTAAGWLDWRRDISGEADFFHASVWVELGHGREQRLRVGMTGMIEHLLGRATFDDTAEIHHGDLIRQVLDNAQIVGDEKIRQPQVGLELGQEVEDLRLYGDVQRAGGLVADEEVRARRRGIAQYQYVAAGHPRIRADSGVSSRDRVPPG